MGGCISTYFLYNGTGLVAEYDANGQLLTEYHYRPNSPWGTNPLFLRTNGTVHYYINDQLGTPQMLINSAGQVTWQASYTAFGKASVTISEVNQPLRFPGQYFDTETNLHYNYFRTYNPATGRYIKTDPIGLAGGLNIYLYAMDNPLRYMDEFGLDPLRDFPLPPGIDPSIPPEHYYEMQKERLPSPKKLCVSLCMMEFMTGEARDALLKMTAEEFVEEIPGKAAKKWGKRFIPWAGWVMAGFSLKDLGECLFKCKDVDEYAFCK